MQPEEFEWMFAAERNDTRLTRKDGAAAGASGSVPNGGVEKMESVNGLRHLDTI